MCLIGALTDLTELQLQKLALDGRLFGYWASFDPPVNNRFKAVDKADLKKRVQVLSDHNRDQIIFI